MQRRSTIIKQLRENIADHLEFARLDEQLGHVAAEGYRRGLAAGYARTLCWLIADKGGEEWLYFNRICSEQATRITALRAAEEADRAPGR